MVYPMEKLHLTMSGHLASTQVHKKVTQKILEIHHCRSKFTNSPQLVPSGPFYQSKAFPSCNKL